MRTVRAIRGAKMKPMQMVTVMLDGPSAEITTTAVMTSGSASNASTNRLMPSSTHPRM